MTIGRAIDYLIGEYFDAMCEERIQKPISYALYQTWQWADAKEKPSMRNICISAPHVAQQYLHRIPTVRNAAAEWRWKNDQP